MKTPATPSGIRFAPLVLTLFLVPSSTRAADALEEGFHSPPDSARPQTWWHWMNGNVTKEGITADLEAMKQIGLGGAEIFNAACGIPPGPVKFNSPEWHAMFTHAVHEADRLGLQLEAHNCAGWSSSGGPWNVASNGMMHVVTSEIHISGPTNFSGSLPQPPKRLDYYRDIAVLAFQSPNGKAGKSPRLDKFETKDGETGDFVDSQSSNRHPDDFDLRRSQTIELSAKLDASGKLTWQVPAGDWTILRAGFTPSGQENHPAPPEGTGLECDKFNPAALDAHWAGFMQKLVADAGPLAGKTFVGSVIDSYEVGGQNWSANFRKEFKRRRGYDPTPFLAAFTGRVVDSPEITERFLWDVRRTIADLFAADYYGHFAELCHRNGLIASIEPYTGPFESLQCGQPADIVMGEFWSGSQGNSSVKLAASVAHIYGKQLVGAESFTASPGARQGRWLDDPYSLKALGDLEYCTGLNRFIFHRYAMQPWTNRWPGMTMGPWGFHFDRTETWWEQGKAWIDYVSRSQFLLQQGRYVADVAYFNGESAPSEMRQGDPPLPEGYQFDAINADVLLHHAKVKNSRLNLDGGASYAVLVLPPDDANLTPALLKCIGGFVHDGLAVVGARPQHSPSLEDFPSCDAEVTSLANKLWGKCDGREITRNAVGKGCVIWGKSLADVFAGLNLPPDFTFQGHDAGSKIIYCHRQMAGAEIYFVSNQRQQFDSAGCSFRVTGRMPELWNAETGSIQPAPVWREENGRTIIPVQFDPAGSVFVVFRDEPRGDHFVSVQHQPTIALVAKTNPPAELKIIQATYGYFPPTGQTWSDVTENVRALVAKGTFEIPANNNFAGDDPAPNIVKQLRVEFNLNGQQESAVTNENETLTLPPSATVTRAIYGELPGPVQTMDLTAKLASLVANGSLNVRADNVLAGRDPANLIPKELRVEYSINGVAKRITVSENETLTLPDSGMSPGTSPVYEMMAGENGGTMLRAFVPGEIDLRTAAGKQVNATISDLPSPLEIAGGWQLSFPPNWGAPDSVVLDKLISWTDHTHPGVKYFSGSAVYEKEIEIPAADLNSNREIWLDLGAVKNFAEVSLNGRPFGVLWKPPFRVNITAAVRPGTNVLRVKVTNLWPNRLIGDEQLPDDREWNGKQLKAWPQWLLDGKPSPTGRLTFTTWHHWTKDDMLQESGLLGPVTIRIAELKSVHPE